MITGLQVSFLAGMAVQAGLSCVRRRWLAREQRALAVESEPWCDDPLCWRTEPGHLHASGQPVDLPGGLSWRQRARRKRTTEDVER